VVGTAAITLRSDKRGFDHSSPPFDHLRGVHPLAAVRSGREPTGHARHQLYAARDARTAANVLVKVTTKPGLVYEQNLANETVTLETINRELRDSRYFPLLIEHGRLADGRIFVVMSLFEEFPLATTVGAERLPERLVGQLRTAIEVATALEQLHGLQIFHVDLNPMNILYRAERGRPVIRIVDFESSYDVARHAQGTAYQPPTTPSYSAPEVADHAPDARADVFSLGAVLYTLIAGFGWTWQGEAGAQVESDHSLDADLKAILLRAVDGNPDRRFASMEQFRTALGGYLERIWPGRAW
jgi:serine/threonine protein kinase